MIATDFKLSECIKFCLIVSSGVYLHINRISILDLKVSKLPGLVPSLSSTIFIFSILLILVAKLPSWPKHLKEPTWIIKVLLELFLILYLTDLIMRNFWVPALKLIGFFCKVTASYLSDKIPFLSVWINKSGYYVVRFLIAASTFALVVEVLGFQVTIREFLEKYRRQQSVTTAVEQAPVTSEASVQPIYRERGAERRSRSRSKRVSFQDSLYARNSSPMARNILDLAMNGGCSNQCSICREAI